MANIILTLDHTIQDGEDIKFKAPCACNEIEGITANYPVESGDGTIGTETKTFTFRDSHGNDLTGLGNLFSEGAYVKVIVDTENGHAYLQNADTNGYLEEKLGSGGGSGWTVLAAAITGSASTLISGSITTKTLDKPIPLPTTGLLEFCLEVFGLSGTQQAGAFLHLQNSAGQTIGSLGVAKVTSTNEYSKSICVLNGANKVAIWTTITVTSAISNAFGFGNANDTNITRYTWEPTEALKSFGYILRYRVLEG